MNKQYIYSPGDVVKYTESDTTKVTYLANYYANTTTPSLFIFNDYNIDIVSWHGGIWSSGTQSLATLNPPNLRGVYCPIPSMSIASPFYTMSSTGLTPFSVASGGTLTGTAGYDKIYGIAQGIVDSSSTASDVRYQSAANYANNLISDSFTVLQTWTTSSAWKTLSGAAQTTRPFGPAVMKDSIKNTIFPGPRIFGPGIAAGARVINGSVVAQGSKYVILWQLDKPIDLTALQSSYYTQGSTAIAPIGTYRINHINAAIAGVTSEKPAGDADTILMGFALPLTQAGGSGLTHLNEVITKHLKRAVNITPVKIKKKARPTKRAK